MASATANTQCSSIQFSVLDAHRLPLGDLSALGGLQGMQGKPARRRNCSDSECSWSSDICAYNLMYAHSDFTGLAVDSAALKMSLDFKL